MRLRTALLPLALLLACGDDQRDGALSREEAADLVVEALVSAGDPVVVLGMAEPVGAGDRIVAFQPDSVEGPEVAIEAEGDAWFFWIDDEPGARFDHPSRFAMVDRATGEITNVDALWWPLFGGTSIWDDAAYDSREDWVYSELPEGESSRSALVPPRLPFADCVVTGGHAVVINGVHADEKGVEDFNKDGANMNDALTDAGLDTTYFGPTGAEGVDKEATFTNLGDYFIAKAAELGPGDTLVVYLGGHGSNNENPGYLEGQTEVGDVWESDLERWLSGFDPGVNVIVMIDGCHAGGMLDSLSCVADLAVSATDRDKSSYGDLDFAGETNPQDNGGEWTSSMLTCWNTLMETPESRDAVAGRAEAGGKNFFNQLVNECYDGAGMYDSAQQRGWAAPMRLVGAPKAGSMPTDPQPPACDGGVPDDACHELELSLQGFGISADNVCEDAIELEEGNETLHSDGVKTSTAEGNVDAKLFHVGVSVGYDLMPCGGDVFCLPGTGTGGLDDFRFAAVDFDGPLAIAGDGFYYQYGLVFDSDGDASNNYRAQAPYPADFYDNTDLWFQLTGSGTSWTLELVDAKNGAFASVDADAQVIIDGSTLIAVLPGELLQNATGMRITSFRHQGDYGVSMPWSGDVFPPVGEPLLPLPE